jgi:hypothetical protein
MLTKKHQTLLIMLFKNSSITRGDAKAVYTNQRSFYTAIKYLKDTGLVLQRGGKNERGSEPTYELTLSGMVFTIMLFNIRVPMEKVREMNEL